MPIATDLDSVLPVSTARFNASPCASSVEPCRVTNETSFTVRDYDLAATLGCGQAFRWELCDDRWRGVVDARWVELRQHGNQIFARTVEPQTNWRWLADYLQVHLDLTAVLATFPADEPMRRAVAACRGLRLLRQPFWECLASFILSSTKQIVQIRQIIGELCTRHGDPVRAPASALPAFAFPRAGQIAALSEQELRDCKMGFRAPYLLAAARAVAGLRRAEVSTDVSGSVEDPTRSEAQTHSASATQAGKQINLTALPRLPLAEARAQLLKLPGVGPKIADCVLLFAGGFPTAFPVDVWVMKALRQSYFRNRRVNLTRLRSFSATHFGPHGGYAQQYLFHSLRLREGKKLSS